MGNTYPLNPTNLWAIGTKPLITQQAKSYAATVFIVLLVVLVRSPYLGDPAADPDEQLYSVMGQAWLAGEMPYRDLWDRKPPGLFALFAGLHWIGGSSPLAYQIPGIACTAASALMIHNQAMRIGTPFGAMIVTALFVLNIPLFFMHLGQSETFLTPLLLIQLIAMRHVFSSDDPAKIFRLLCGVMALGGIALQIKYSVLPFCALLAAMAAFRLWQLHVGVIRFAASLMLFAILGLLPTFLFAAYFASQGEFESFFFANFVSIFLRSEFYPLLAQTNIQKLSTAVFPLGAYALLSVITAYKMRGRIDGILFAMIAGFTGVGAFSLIMLGSPFVHYFGLTLPFICLLAATFFSHHTSHKVFSAVALILALGCASFAEQLEHSSSHRAAISNLTTAIQNQVPQDECLFIFDGPSILYTRSGRCIPTRMAFAPHLNSHHERTALDVNPAQETARILAQRPGAIIVTDAFNTPQFVGQTRDMVRRALVDDYVLAQVTPFYPVMLELYIRADLAPKEVERNPSTTAVPCTLRYGRPCEIFTPFSD